MHKTRGRLSRAFKYFIACYLALLVCIIAPIFGILTMMRSTSLNDAVRISELELSYCGNELDEMISAANETSVLIGKNTTLKRVSAYSGISSGSIAYEMYMAMNEFSSIAPFTYDFKTVFLYYPSTDVVITPNSVYCSLEEYCRFNFPEISDISMKEALSGDSNSSIQSVNNHFFIFNSVMFDYTAKKKAICCFYISQSSINGAMKSKYNESMYAIVNNKGEIVSFTVPLEIKDALKQKLLERSESSFVETLSGEKYLIARRYSSTGSVLYASMIPASSVTARIDSISQIVYLSVAAVTAISIGAIVILSLKNTKLIRGFVTAVSPETAQVPKDEFYALESGIETLKSTNNKYLETLAKQRTSLEVAFFSRLYMGAFANEVDMISTMNEAGLAITGAHFTVSLIQADDKDFGVQMALSGTFDEQFFIHPLRENMYTILTVTNEEKDIEALIAEKFPFELEIFTGKTVSSLMEAAESFESAQRQKADAQKDVQDESQAEELELKIRMYIMENFLNPELSLSSLAKSLNMSEPYVSGYFKRRTGKNISSYVEQLRVDKAYSLLTETGLPIKDIVEMCGYQNDQTFRRAFKKLKGCTPGQVRAEE